MNRLLCLTLASALLGCSALLDTDGYKLANGETTDSHSQPCEACTQESCATELAACSEVLSCREHQHCVDQCQAGGTSLLSCDAICLQDFWDFGLTNEVTACQSGKCEAPCGRQCGGWAYRVDGCASCIQVKCCEQASACSNESECRNLFTCYSNCTPGDWGCYLDCNNNLTNSETLALSASFENCLYDKCAIQCEAGRSWNCVGKVGNIDYSPREVMLSLQFYALNLDDPDEPIILDEPLEGVTVLLCRRIDTDCDKPIASVLTNAQGIAEFRYTINNESEADVRLKISKTGRMSASLTFSSPLSYGPHMVQYWILPTLEELAFFAEKFGVEIDPLRGHALVYMQDCAMGGAADLVVSAPAAQGSTPFYFRSWRLDNAADRTDRIGLAGFFNLPQGNTVVEAAPFGDEGSIVLKESINVRPGEISFALLWPR